VPHQRGQLTARKCELWSEQEGEGGRGLDHQAGVEVGDVRGQNLNDSGNRINRPHPSRTLLLMSEHLTKVDPATLGHQVLQVAGLAERGSASGWRNDGGDREL